MLKDIRCNYFVILIILSNIIYFLWLVKLLNDFPWRYVFSDWIINYHGGYIRRGFLGEISIFLSNNLSINIKYIFFIIHLLIYTCFHFVFFKFFNAFKKNYVFYFICFSPLVFLYPLSVFESFARKEIFYITFFLTNCYISLKISNRKIIFFTTNLFVIFSYLIHESFVFFIGFFYLSYLVFLKKNKYKINLYEIVLIIFVYIILFYLLLIPVTEDKISEMVLYINENFYKITESSGAISWLNRSASSSLLFLKVNNISFKHLTQNILYLHFYFIFFYILYKEKIFLSDKFYSFLIFAVFLSPLFLFFIGNDWGRFVYIIYNFCLIFTFYCLYDKKEIFLGIDKLTKISKININLKYLLTIGYLSLWTPKLFFYDNVVLFPLFILLKDLIKYTFKYTQLILF